MLGANKTVAISRTHSAFVQGFANISLSTASLSTERNEYGASIGYAIDWIPEFTTTFFYRYAYYDYAEGPRADSNHTFALSLIWRIRPTAFLQLSANSDTSLTLGCRKGSALHSKAPVAPARLATANMIKRTFIGESLNGLSQFETQSATAMIPRIAAQIARALWRRFA